MTSRILPPEEWDRLSDTDIPNILPHVGPTDMHIVVVEDEGRIVGCWALMPMLHLEGLWIAPEYRGRSSVARRLLKATWAEVKRLAPRWVMTGCCDDTVRRLLTRHMNAAKVPSDSYLIAMQGEKRCHSLL